MAEQEKQPRSADDLNEGINYLDNQIREIAQEGLNADGSRRTDYPVIQIIEEAWPLVTARRALRFALGLIPLAEVVPPGVIKTTAEEQLLGLPEFPKKGKMYG